MAELGTTQHLLGFHAARRTAVCDRCDAIDSELATFQRLRATIKDDFTLTLIAIAVEGLQSEKTSLHSDKIKGREFSFDSQ